MSLRAEVVGLRDRGPTELHRARGGGLRATRAARLAARRCAFRLCRAVALVMCVLPAGGCGGGEAPSGAGPAPPSFAQIQAEILSPTCAVHDCHMTPPALLLLPGHSHAALVGRPSRQRPGLLLVRPGDPERSYLVHKLRGDRNIAGIRMPVDRPPLSPEQEGAIIAWIRAGAGE